jgi:putative flippase GtrA
MATAADFSVYFVLFHFISTYYVTASGIGAFCGATLSFFLSRHWAFKSTEDRVRNQMIRYGCASGLSLFLNVYGIYFVVETFGIEETIAKVLTSISIGLFINFPIFRCWVFRDRE